MLGQKHQSYLLKDNVKWQEHIYVTNKNFTSIKIETVNIHTYISIKYKRTLVTKESLKKRNSVLTFFGQWS